MLRITATHADEWNTWGAPPLAGANMAKLHAACERVERDPSTVRTCAQALVIVTDDATTIEKVRGGGMAERTIVGSIDQIVDEVGGYVEFGFDEFIVPDFAIGGGASERHTVLTELLDSPHRRPLLSPSFLVCDKISEDRVSEISSQTSISGGAG